MSTARVAHWTPEYGPAVPGQMRRAVRAKLTEWGARPDDGALLALDVTVSELVTNAIKFGGVIGRLDLFLYLDDETMTVEVWDGEGPTQPHIPDADDHDESGRGLHLVNTLVERLWCTRDGCEFAKKVCAEIPLTTPARTADHPRPSALATA
ncbi:hypothetical protein GCM10009760_19790 [Kitasatospora kazusensis]|uniref:Histidine kinase/HSP90-like ATPase domain-containing protein n=1 Tax=Kitasatospora kazusensis TaxID=407974 RepID=A0ABN2Z8J8_9ACTN